MTQPSFSPVPQPTRSALPCGSRPLQTGAPTGSRTCTSRSSPTDGPLGAPGPDQGYALKLAEDLFSDRLELVAGERAEDAVFGCAMVASAEVGDVRQGAGWSGPRYGLHSFRIPRWSSAGPDRLACAPLPAQWPITTTSNGAW